MPLTPGTRLGVYDITAAIGAGGMGEVYRAKDTKLGRDVALKILPASFTSDPERVARFRREAQVLASLNHPHIAQIYGIDEINGTQFLVLELVDGESLDTRIARGPVPVDEALEIAKQIAEALEAAHEKGIIHRDLKPANIALTHDGSVKVLDFGLAKAVETTSGPSDAMNSPTITSPGPTTGISAILGTAAYMSPEQAKGRPADKRSDIWAFGCVLYEMLAGVRPFNGDDMAETLAALLRGEPDWRALPAGTPDLIRNLIARCLAKDPKRRVGSFSVSLFALGAASLSDSTSSTAERRPVWQRPLPVVAAIAVAAAAVGTAVGLTALRPRSVPPLAVTRFAIPLPEEHRSFGASTIGLAISPDGSLIAYSAAGQRKPGLYLRPMAALESKALPGVGAVMYPTFSPDSRFIAFLAADRTLRRVSVNGGPADTLCSVSETVTGLSWDKSGVVFSLIRQGIMRVSAPGSEPQQLIRPRDGEILRAPTLLPGGDAVMFSIESGTGIDPAENVQIVAQSLATGERKSIVRRGTDARYLASGYVVYVDGSTVFVLPFDVRSLTANGQPVPVLEGVRQSFYGVAELGVSESGSLVYLPGPASSSSSRSDLEVMTLDGSERPLSLPPAAYEHPRASPVDTQIVYDTENGSEASVWIYDLSGTTPARRITFAGSNRFPIWSGDGKWIAFQSREGDFGIFAQRADGSGQVERLTTADRGTAHVPDSWSRDGMYLLYETTKDQVASLWALSLRDKRVISFEESGSRFRFNAVFSPDGRWVAYARPAGGGIVVRPFPPAPTSARYQLSSSGMYPLWAPDGNRVFYNIPGQIAAVTVTTQPSRPSAAPLPPIAFGNPVALPRGTFLVPGPFADRNHDIMRDGNTIVGVIPAVASDQSQASGASLNQIQVVINWVEELKRERR